MTSREVRETIRLLSPDAPVFRPDPDRRRRRNAMRTAERWADGMNSPHWGWKIAWTHHRDRQPLPPGIRNPAIRRAYHFLHGQEDENMAVAVSLHLPGSSDQRIVLHGLLCARDITLEGIGRLLDLDREVVELYEALFFNVRGRDRLYLSSVICGGTRLLSIRDAETGPALTERLLMQLGRDYGWREVASWAGIIPVEDDTPIDDAVEDLHRLAFGNALMIGRAGWFNRRSEGLRYAGSLIAARPAEEAQKDADARRGLAGMSLALSVNQSFMRIMQPQLERRLAVQRGLDVEKANQPNVTEARPSAAPN